MDLYTMEIALSFLAILVLAYAGMSIYGRYGLPAPVDSLRAGRLHHVALGILIGLLLSRHPRLIHLFEGLRTSLIGLGLVWFGFLAGLEFDLRRFRSYPARQTIRESVQTLGATVLLFLMAIVARAPLKAYLNVAHEPVLYALALGVSASLLRVPELVFHWRGPTYIHPSDTAGPRPICTNTAGLVLLCALYPFASGSIVFRLGLQTVVEPSSRLFVLLASGLGLGIVLDFTFRAFKETLSSIYLATGVIATVGGCCIAFGIPGLAVGFWGGIWLINTTVRKREVLEQTERAGAVIEPLFFVLLGSLLDPFELEWAPLLLFAAAILVARGLARTLSVAVVSRVSREYLSWQEILRLSLRPLGSLSAGVAAQLLVLAPHHRPDAFVAAMLLAVFLSQTLPVFRPREAPLLPPVRRTPLSTQEPAGMRPAGGTSEGA